MNGVNSKNGVKKPKQKRVYFLEGNISSGKSTVVEGLKNAGFSVFDEPVNTWTETYVEDDGENILKKFYGDMSRWSFQFEVAIMTTRFKRLVEALNHDSEIVLLERSLWTDRKCFAQNLFEQGHMTSMEWAIYTDWFNTFMEATKYVLAQVKISYVHLQTKPEECHRRMNLRQRKEEKGVPLDYLKLLGKKHEEWLTDEWNHDIIAIDGHKSAEEVLKDIISALN